MDPFLKNVFIIFRCLRNCIFNIKSGGGAKEKEYSVKFVKEVSESQSEEFKESERIEEK